MELTRQQINLIKVIRKNVQPNWTKIEKIEEKLDALVAERTALINEIDGMESYVRQVTDGFRSTDIFEKTTNDKGQVVYVLRFPDTILPPSTIKTEEREEEDKIGNSDDDTDISEQYDDTESSSFTPFQY